MTFIWNFNFFLCVSMSIYLLNNILWSIWMWLQSLINDWVVNKKMGQLLLSMNRTCEWMRSQFTWATYKIKVQFGFWIEIPSLWLVCDVAFFNYMHKIYLSKAFNFTKYICRCEKYKLNWHFFRNLLRA